MKAVIAAAGLGTRFLPFTKATPKEMLPIIDKPVIQLIVEDLVSAGVTDIIIVTSEGKEAIEEHFTINPELNAQLEAKGKAHLIDDLANIESLANFTFVHQTGDKYGTSVPLVQVKHLLDDEPFFYFFADDFYRTSGSSQTQQLLDVHKATKGGSVLTLQEIIPEDSVKYGVADVDTSGEFVMVKSVVEKPKPEDAPSNIAVSSGFLLTPDVFEYLNLDDMSARGEYEYNEAVSRLAKTDSGLFGCIVDGVRHDTGNKPGYLQAVVDIALEDEVVGTDFREYLKSRLND